MDKVTKFIDVMQLIAFRKASFYKEIVEEARKSNHKINEKETKNKIANAKNVIFISAAEKISKKLNPETDIKDIELDKEMFIVSN